MSIGMKKHRWQNLPTTGMLNTQDSLLTAMKTVRDIPCPCIGLSSVLQKMLLVFLLTDAQVDSINQQNHLLPQTCHLPHNPLNRLQAGSITNVRHSIPLTFDKETGLYDILPVKAHVLHSFSKDQQATRYA